MQKWQIDNRFLQGRNLIENLSLFLFVHKIQIPRVYDLQVQLHQLVHIGFLFALLSFFDKVLDLLPDQLKLQERGLRPVGSLDEVVLRWEWKWNRVAVELGSGALLLEVTE